ncbi:MAG: AAA family ATPase [Gemmatimonadaceae bacterium]
MYEQFFGLTEKPFSLTPNPRFVFQSDQYRVAEESLRYGIGQKEGFMLVTGAPGTGKTTLCRDLLEKLDPERFRVALLFNPFLNGVEMLQALLSEFGLGDTTITSRKELLDRLNTYLLQQLANGRTCIAIFDEAQHLSTEFLEQIRVLSNLETEREKLIQIVLVGQPELLALIRTPQMAQLDQRVSVRCTLTHLTQDETGRYLYHRLNVAGAQGRVRFQETAVRLIHSATRGVPRLINLTTDRALLAGYSDQARSISEAHVRQAIASLQGEDGMESAAASAPAKTLSTSGHSRRWWVGGSLAAVAAVLAALWFGMDGNAEVLAWRAARAPSTVRAEQFYARIARDYAGSRQRENALLRLAQLQLTRGSNEDALRSLETLGRDYPAGWAIGEGRYWTAKAFFAAGDSARACAAAGRVPVAATRAVPADYSSMSEQCVAFESRRLAADSVSDNAMATADTTRRVVPAGEPQP